MYYCEAGAGPRAGPGEGQGQRLVITGARAEAEAEHEARARTRARAAAVASFIGGFGYNFTKEYCQRGAQQKARGLLARPHGVRLGEDKL